MGSEKGKGKGKRRPAQQADRTKSPPAQADAGNPLPRWIAVSAVFSLFLFLLLIPLFTQRVEPRWDARDFFYPAFAYLADSVAEGRFPLWDPYSSCGLPFHAYPECATLNPVALALGQAIDNSGVAFVAFWAFLWWWGGMGMIWWARFRGATPAGGLVAALAYALSGFLVGHGQHTSYIGAVAWIPWIFLFAESAVARANWGYALLAGAAMGLSTYGGYPGLVSFTGLAVAIWLGLGFLGGDAAPEGPGSLPVRQRLYRVAGTLAIMAVMAIVAWSPILKAFFTEGAGYTDRASQFSSDVLGSGGRFTLPAMFSFFFPYATVAGRPWLGTDISMANGYVGSLAVPLAAVWLVKGAAGRARWRFVLFAAFMFLFSVGGYGGLRTALYYLFPPLRYVRFTGIFRIYWILAVAIAAGLGYSRLARHAEDRRFALSVLLGWAAAALLTAVGLALFLDSHDVPLGTVIDRLYLPGGAILLMAIPALWFWSRERFRRHAGAVSVFVLILVHADMAGHLYNNHETAWVPRDSIREAEALHRRSTSVDGDPGPRLQPLAFGYYNAQLVLKKPVVMGYSSFKSRGFDEVLCRSRFVEVMMAAPRFWIAPGGEKAPSEEIALAALSNTGYGTPVPAFVDEGPPAPPTSRVVPGTFGTVRTLAYAPEKVDLEIEVPGPGNALLLGTERYAAGWTVTIDGVRQKVLKTNLYFRGVSVPPGRHIAAWRYEPRSWIPLVCLGYATLLLGIGGGVILIWKGRAGTLRPAEERRDS